MLALSLPSGYLTGAEDGDDVARWRAILGEPAEGLALVRRWGVVCIEVGDLRGSVAAETVRAAVTAIAAAGLTPHAHLWLPPDIGRHGVPAALASAVAAVGSGPPSAPAACALHGHKRHEEDAAQRSVDDLCALEPWLRAHGTSSALEVCRYRPQGPLGGTYDEVVDLIEAAEARIDRALGATWDLGHTAWNALVGHDREWPDERFLHRVTHVHVHDLAESGRTHFPLDEGRVPLDGMIERLQAVGYAGWWDLEVYPERWPDDPPRARERLQASLERLGEAIG